MPLPDSSHGRRTLTRSENVVAVLGFPLLITAGIGSHIAAIERGIEPNVAALALTLVSFAIVATLERFFPWQQSWLHSQGDLRTDAGLALVNSAATRIFDPAMLAALSYVGAAAAQAFGLGLWPSTWPWVAQLAFALVLVEFGEYWFHRAMHEVPFLWRFHATHHSSPRLYWLNAARFHPIDAFFVALFKGMPLALLGAPLPVFALVNLFSTIHGMTQHANMPVRQGPLNWVFSLTELHRWHHSRRLAEANHNYGGNLILWDIVFGTRWLPDDRDPPEGIGIETMPAFPMGFWANLLAPFRWKKVEDESRATR